MKRAISCELKETSLRLLVAFYRLEGRNGRLNRATLEWVHARAKRYAGPNPSDKVLAGVSGLLKGSDADLATLAAQWKAKAEPVLFIPLEHTSYTSAVVHELDTHDSAYVVGVLDILSHLRIFNSMSEDSRYFSRLTFTAGLTNESYKNAIINAEQFADQTAYRARVIVDKISALEDEFPSS